jgi:hypothetical protein
VENIISIKIFNEKICFCSNFLKDKTYFAIKNKK